MIPVTKPFLPEEQSYLDFIRSIIDRGWLTNNGPLVRQLEEELSAHLDVKHLLFTGNGTIALQIAIKALDLKGEIITTPFSYVATTSSIAWENCKPVFADIDPNTWNIDVASVENAITEKTSAILATHVFGNACDVEAISALAERYGLKVIYDGAHCFGVKYKGKSIFSYGDISTSSFHATKIFHTIEGGAVMTEDAQIAERMKFLRNFGHDGFENFNGIGINGKNSEVHAAMGLCVLPHMEEIMARRKSLHDCYDNELRSLALQKQQITAGTDYNYSYYPVLFASEEQVIRVLGALKEKDIFPRRYFYPPLNSLDYIDRCSMPVTEGISRRILCLPLYHTLTEKEVKGIANAIKECI